MRFTDFEKQRMFQTAARRAAARITGTPAEPVAELLGDLTHRHVLGAFVSFKRNHVLRSCMGCLKPEGMELGLALEGAATLAATEDPRFPPIAVAELAGLDLEVWILSNMVPLTVVSPDERVAAVQIGRHGLQITSGNNRGLLLPGVAVDHNMDAETFLIAVCKKAGLPETAWKNPNCTLATFEGELIAAPFDRGLIVHPKTSAAMSPKILTSRYICCKPGPNMVELNRLRDHLRENFLKILHGAMPMTYLAATFDGNVAGVALSLLLPDYPVTICSKITHRDELPLQATLCELAEALVTQLRQKEYSVPEILTGTLELSIFWDPMLHGNGTGCQLTHLDPLRRAFVVSGPDSWVLQYSPEIPPPEMVESAIEYLEMENPDTAQVLSFETMSTIPHIMATSLSKPILGADIRPSAVAGAFYPAAPDVVQTTLDRIITAAVESPIVKKYRSENKTSNKTYRAAIVPHAGWIYSGELAAQTLACIDIPEHVIIFAPKHRSGGHDWAVAPHSMWSIPGGTVSSDISLAQRIVDTSDWFQLDSVAHEKEHAIEVLLPILHQMAPQTKVVGVIVHNHSWNQLYLAAKQFSRMLQEDFLAKNQRLPLLVVSSDMNHFASEESTRVVDRMALDVMRELQPEHLLETVLSNRISMCGIAPTVFVMETLRQLGMLAGCDEVGYTTSAAQTGDTQRVVGYAGMLFW